MSPLHLSPEHVRARARIAARDNRLASIAVGGCNHTLAAAAGDIVVLVDVVGVGSVVVVELDRGNHRRYLDTLVILPHKHPRTASPRRLRNILDERSLDWRFRRTSLAAAAARKASEREDRL